MHVVFFIYLFIFLRWQIKYFYFIWRERKFPHFTVASLQTSQFTNPTLLLLSFLFYPAPSLFSFSLCPQTHCSFFTLSGSHLYQSIPRWSTSLLSLSTTTTKPTHQTFRLELWKSTDLTANPSMKKSYQLCVIGFLMSP